MDIWGYCGQDVNYYGLCLIDFGYGIEEMGPGCNENNDCYYGAETVYHPCINGDCADLPAGDIQGGCYPYSGYPVSYALLFI